MKIFEVYAHAAAYAQAKADAACIDYGIERTPAGWVVFGLPCRACRQGIERRCEVRMPTGEALPGHGVAK